MRRTGRYNPLRSASLAESCFWRSRSLRPRDRGQVLVIAIIAMTLLVALIFHVYNTGDQVSARLALQNVADAVAVSGAGWMARSMNTVAMNNIAQSRMIALIPVMDALPLATRMALEEATEWEKCLDRQGASIRGNGSIPDYLKEGLEALRERMATQRDLLIPVNETFSDSGFRMEEHTHWSVGGVGGAPPNGKMWRAAVALQAFNQAAIDSSGPLAQAQGVRMAGANGVSAAFLVPIVPGMPVRLGGFDDFRPLIQGRVHVESEASKFSWRTTGGNGGAIPDCAYPHRLGPFARTFRWRYNAYRRTERGEYVPGPKTRGGTGNVNVGGRRVGGSARGRNSGYWRGGANEVVGYNTYGPYHWALRHVHWYADDGWWRRQGQYARRRDGHVPDTFFYPYTKKIADIKLGYMFPARTGKTLKTIHYPIWVTPYPEARALARRPDVKVDRTMFYLVEIASSVPEDDPNWLKAGTYRTNGDYPISIWCNGWQDPAGWSVPRVAEWVWKDSYTYETTEDRGIGLRPEVDPTTGEPVWQTVYMVGWYVFGGIDVGGDWEVGDPSNWSDLDEIPRPFLYDTSHGDYDPRSPDPDNPYRREWFTYLGIARGPNTSAVWPQRFGTVNPMNAMAAMAQAKVFNNSSWDLWTQDWQVQLTPRSRWHDWVERLEAGEGDLDLVNGIVPLKLLQDMLEYMRALDSDIAEVFTNI